MSQPTTRPFGWRDNVAYAAGDFGCNMSFALKSTLIIFWTQYMGMSSGLYALLLIIVQVWDAINDPLIGALIDSDRRVYKRHKFLAYMFVGALGLLLAGTLCFLPIPSASTAVKIAVFIVGYIVWDAFYTIANVPYGSMLTLITKDVGQRASLSAWRSVGTMLGNMVPLVILPFIIYDEGNDLIGERVFLTAFIMGILGFFAFLYTIRNTVIRVPSKNVTVSDNETRFRILPALRRFIKNRPAVGATVAAMGMFLGLQGSTAAVTVLFQSYFHNVQVSGIIQVFSMIPIFVFTPFAGKMVKRYGKKELCVVGAVCSVVASLAMLVLPIEANISGIWIYAICQLINSLGIGVYSTVSWSLMGDAIDYNEWQHGTREEGTVYSLHAFFRKLAQGLGPSLVLIIMAALGYVEANKGNQTLAVSTNMRYFVPLLYLFSAVIMLVGLGFIYNLNKHRVQEMHCALGLHNDTKGEIV